MTKEINENVDLKSILGDTISEEQVTEIQTLFNDAVNEVAKEKIAAEVAAQLVEFSEKKATELADDKAKLVEEYEAAGKQLVEDYKARVEQLEEQANEYLTESVKTWIDENKQTAADRIKLQIFESFTTGMRQLMVESGIDIPDSQLDLAEANEKELADRDTTIKGLQESVDVLKEAVTNLTCEKIFSETVQGLSEMQADKLRELSATLIIESSDDYKNKLVALKEAISVKTHDTQEPKATLKEDNSYRATIQRTLGYTK